MKEGTRGRVVVLAASVVVALSALAFARDTRPAELTAVSGTEMQVWEQESGGLRITASLPKEVAVGESFELTLHVTDARGSFDEHRIDWDDRPDELRLGTDMVCFGDHYDDPTDEVIVERNAYNDAGTYTIVVSASTGGCVSGEYAKVSGQIRVASG